MRILMIIDGLPGGGAEKVVLTLSEGLIHQGHKVTLLSLRDVCSYAIPEQIEYKVVNDDCRTPWRKLNELSRRAKQLDQCFNELENSEPAFDLIISNLHKTDRIVSKSRIYSDNRLWFCIHGVLSSTYLGHRKGLSRWFKKQKMASVYQNKNIISVSEFAGKDLQTNMGVRARHLEVINNPFDLVHTRELAAAECELAGTPYLIHVARFHVQKRHDRLLRAYAKTELSAPLVLLGTGPEEKIAEVKALAETLGITDRLIFLGFQKNPFPYIKNAKLLVMSSDSEGFGNVLAEALILNTPVVSTRCPGGPEEILIGELSRGLSDINADALAERILDIYNNPPAIDPTTLSRFELQIICKQYAALANISALQ